MTRRSHSNKSHWLSSGGVALADILANSVAVMLVLITLSYTIKQQQAEEQINTAVDFNILMARKISDSVVMNALPSSKPAYLHNYHDCSIPHDCQPSLYPIIELHKGFVREFNSGSIFTATGLQQQTDNRFDALISTWDATLVNNIRVDVYDISMFYLAISILREHNAPLWHWHFLGELHTPPSRQQSIGDNKSFAEQLAAGQLGNTTGESAADGSSTSQTHLAGANLPTGTSAVDPNAFNALEDDSLIPPANIEQHAASAAAQGDGDGQSAAASQPQLAGLDAGENRGQALFEQLLGEIDEQRNGKSTQDERRQFSVNLPNLDAPAQPSGAPQTILEIPPEQYEIVMLTYLLQAIETAQLQRGFDYKQLQQLLARIVINPDSIQKFHLANWVKSMALVLRNTQKSAAASLPIEVLQSESSPPLIYKVPANQALHTMTLLGKPLQTGSWQQLGAGKPDVLLRLYPYVHRGERIPVYDNYFMLMHPDDLGNTTQSWRAVAIFDPTMAQVTLGYIFAGFANGALQIPADVNQVRIDGIPLTSAFTDITKQRNSSHLTWLYVVLGIAITLILIFIMFGNTMNNSRKILAQ